MPGLHKTGLGSRPGIAWVSVIHKAPGVFHKLFDAQVASILLYSAEIWVAGDCSIIENVHLQAMKKYLSLPMKAPNLIIYDEC